MSLLLYIDDQLADISPGTVIATTIQRLSIGDITGRGINYTNRIKLPKTSANKIIFGFADDENSTTVKPYTALPCTLINGGTEIINDGICELTGATDFFEIQIYENSFSLFSYIKNKTLSDLNPIAPSAWTAAGIDAARLNTSGIVTVVIHWGRATIYNVNFFLPCFYYHTIITSILDSTGLTMSGDILTDQRFKDLVIPYPGEDFIYTATHLQSVKASALQGATVQLTSISVSTNYTMPVDVVDAGSTPGLIDVGADTYTCPVGSDGIIMTISLSTNLLVDWGTATGSTIQLHLYKNGSFHALVGSELAQPDTSATISGDTEITAAAGDVYKGVIVINVGSGTIATIDIDTSLLSGFIASTTIDRDMVSWVNLWPTDINTNSLIKDFFVRFGIVHKQVNETLHLKTLTEICQDRAGAIDWSSKVIPESDIDFDTGYEQDNYYKYTDSVNDDSLGRGNLERTNSVTGGSKTIYTSPFLNATTAVIISGYNVATIPVYDSGSATIDDFANEPGLHLLTLKARTTEAAITFDATSRTDYKLGYFVDATKSKDTGFQYFADQFYSELTAALQKGKIITRYFNLSDVDIANYDVHKMIYDGNGYYLVNKIRNYISGKVTKVELFKIS